MNMKKVDYSKHIYQIKDSEVLLCIAKINNFKEKQASYPKTKPTELDKLDINKLTSFALFFRNLQKISCHKDSVS